MKTVLLRITHLVASMIFSLALFAQQQPKKQSSKEMAEKGSRGDLIIGKREQQKSLGAPRAKINEPDSARPLPKKTVNKTVRKSKKNKLL